MNYSYFAGLIEKSRDTQAGTSLHSAPYYTQKGIKLAGRNHTYISFVNSNYFTGFALPNLLPSNFSGKLVKGSSQFPLGAKQGSRPAFMFKEVKA